MTQETIKQAKPAGRPKGTGMADAKCYNVYLDGDTVDKAKAIGKGSLSKGIRKAIATA